MCLVCPVCRCVKARSLGTALQTTACGWLMPCTTVIDKGWAARDGQAAGAPPVSSCNARSTRAAPHVASCVPGGAVASLVHFCQST